MKNWIRNCLILASTVVSITLVAANSAPIAAPQGKVVQQEYEFVGRHLLASYHDCDVEALKNIKQLPEVMKQGVNASGAQLLDSVEYVFAPDGLTMVLLLSESHASIHTYPEHGACFIDFFTCGTRCSAEKFDDILRAFLKPKKVDKQIIMRE